MEVMSRFKGLDLVDKVPKELWTEVDNIMKKATTTQIPTFIKDLLCERHWANPWGNKDELLPSLKGFTFYWRHIMYT